jgi:uncharacterized protein (DUF3820 family)
VTLLGWGLWVLAVIGTFAYFEWKGLTTPGKIPLTTATRLWFHSREHTPRGRLGRVLFLCLFVSFPAWWLLHVLNPGFV